MTKLHYVLMVAMICRIAGFPNAHIVRAAQAVGGLAGVGRVWSADPGKGRGFNFAFALAGGRRCVVGSDVGVAVLSLGDGHLRGWVARTTPKGWRVDCGTVSPGGRYFAFIESRLFHDRERLQVFRSSDLKRLNSMEVPRTVNLALSRGGTWVAAGGLGKALIWPAQGVGRQVVLRLPGQTSNHAIGVAFSTDKKCLYGISGQLFIKWNIATKSSVFMKRIRVSSGRGSTINAVQREGVIVSDGAGHVWL